MSKNYTAVATIDLPEHISYAHPPSLPEVAHLEDGALTVMTDLSLNHAITIRPDAVLNEAAVEMEACNVHMLLVTDKNNQLLGMITTEGLLGEKPLTVAMSRQIKRSEVLVRMVMIRREDITAFDIEELRHAKIGDIVESLHLTKQHYGLVLETTKDAEKPQVRGIFSLWDISRRVGSNLTYDVSEAHSLAELQRNLDN